MVSTKGRWIDHEGSLPTAQGGNLGLRAQHLVESVLSHSFRSQGTPLERTDCTMRPMNQSVLLASVALVALSGCKSDKRPLAPVSPVVVIGIDGVDPVVLNGLLAAGRVPSFQRFADDGTLGRLGTFAPTWSPVIWTTIATGQDAKAHGVNDFLEADSGKPYTSNTRRVPAIWNLASNAGRTVDCVGWWITWPAEPVNGRLVASYAAQAQAKIIWKPTLWKEMEEQTYPSDLAEEIEPFLILANDAEELRPKMRKAFPIPDELDAHRGRLVNDLAWVHAADLSIAAVTGHMLDSGNADLTMAYLALPDVVGHRFWRYHAPDDMHYDVTEEDQAAFGDYLSLSYIEADRLLGELLAKVPDDATVIILSDHGMHVDPVTMYEELALTSGAHEDAAPGIIGVIGPYAAKQGNVLDQAHRGDVYQVAPMLMHLLDLPVPEHWRGAAAGRIPLERILAEEWRVAHPLTRSPNTDGEYRAATAPRVPATGTSEAFKSNFEAIGYLGGNEQQVKDADAEREAQRETE